jgi:Methane oxygenase PmoA
MALSQKSRTVMIAMAGSLGFLSAGTLAAGPPGSRDQRLQDLLSDARPVPSMQVIPLPEAQASFRRDGLELTRAYFGPALRRPFLFPVIGPSGRSLTRMGHPHDPESHSHHNSVWAAHDSVNGDSFWSDNGPGRVIHQRVVRFEDSEDGAALVTTNAWVGKADTVHLLERRGILVQMLDDREWLMTLDLQFEAPKQPVTLGATAFGMIGVRMAKTIGVNDGGGLIRNSAGQINELGPNGAFRKRARWVDYSGPVTRDAAEGITLLDHPANPNHPTHFHVRGDGWMGASLTYEKPIRIEPGQLLRLRYGLYIHGGVPSLKAIDARWGEFARTNVTDLPNK